MVGITPGNSACDMGFLVLGQITGTDLTIPRANTTISQVRIDVVILISSHCLSFSTDS